MTTRPNPEELLRQVEAAERAERRGKLKVFLGYASGVGKSFRMLDEGRRRKARGQDVVLAAVQPQAPPEVEALLPGFEILPGFHVPAILRRHPGVCLIDGLAYDNPKGSKNAHRWQDVEELLEAGISVITTINLQYVAERQPQVEAIRGRRVRESVPESFLRQADEIEIVDAPAEQHNELREIALVLAAEVVEQRVEPAHGTHERILVCITPRSNAELMIARARRQADRFHAALFVAYVEQQNLSVTDRQTLAQNLEAARRAEARVEILHGRDPVTVLLDFARLEGITQLFIGHSRRAGWLQLLRPNPVERLVREAGGIDVRIFPNPPATP